MTQFDDGKETDGDDQIDDDGRETYNQQIDDGGGEPDPYDSTDEDQRRRGNICVPLTLVTYPSGQRIRENKCIPYVTYPSGQRRIGNNVYHNYLN